MSNHNFILGPVDTDSISFCKPDQSEFSEEERKNLLAEINSLLPELINFADDGYYETVLVLKTKNYVLKKKNKKPIYKGSALKATLKELRLKDFIKDLIKEIGLERNNFEEVYHKYVKEIHKIQDVTPWCTKKTITSKVLNGTRTNETKVMDVIEGTDYREGDKIFVYYTADGSLRLRENFNNDHDVNVLLKKLFKTAKIFETLLDMDNFLDYSIKRNKKKLEEVLNA
jgi:hypothetical protein